MAYHFVELMLVEDTAKLVASVTKGFQANVHITAAHTASGC
jgi:hypothetical protein